MAEQGLTRNRVIADLTKSPHGKLGEYVDIGKKAIQFDPAFYAHLCGWDRINGQIRDSKVALPIIGLAFESDAELVDHYMACFASLGPREFLRGFHFSREVRAKGKMTAIRNIVGVYLHQKEADKGWDFLAVQHRRTLKELYAVSHTAPGPHANDILFKGVKPKGSVFEAIANLRNMSPTEAAGTILKYKIPFLIAIGALGEKAKNPDLALSLIQRMSPTELVTNTALLEKLGMKTNPALRGAFDEALKKAATSKKNTLKTTAAINAERKDGTSVLSESTKEKLRGLQDKQIAALGGPDGNWLVLADKSGSMQHSIEASKHVAATLAKVVTGKVWLVFFDNMPSTVDVTGLSLDQIQKATRHFRASGGTSIGCGLARMLAEKVELDGIAIVSDGGEGHAPHFSDVYKKYSEFVGKEVPVYFYQLSGDPDYFTPRMHAAGIDFHTFDIRGNLDFYSLPNLCQTMRSNVYSLADEIMAVPLLTLNSVLKGYEKGMVTV